MTLKSRNRLFLAAFIITLISMLSMTALYVWAFISGKVGMSGIAVRPLNIFPKIFVFSSNFYASLSAIVFFSLYVPGVFLVLMIGFEKTQSTEILYFFCFLLACFMETFRLFVPVDGLWKSNSSFLSFTGRMVFTGRLMAPLSFLFASVFYETEQRQDAGRNIISIILLSLFAGLVVPLKTVSVLTTNTVMWGYEKLFFVVRTALEVITFVTLLVNTYSKSMDELKPNVLGYVLIILGYSLLIVADNIVFAITGSLLLLAGTFIYLRSIHKMYMWR